MKLNSLETSELLDKLAVSAGWWRRFIESNQAEEIHQIILELSPRDLASLDQRARGYSAYKYYNLKNWQNLRPSDVSRLAKSRFATSLVGLASFHFNGYVREAAIGELASHRTGKELPFLLIRLNDWVPHVREAAAKEVRNRIEPEYAIHLLANISLVIRLRICGRAEKKIVDDICDLLKRPECKDVLLAGIKSKDKTARRISFQLAAETEPSSRTSIISALMTDPDGVARSWAVRHFLPDVQVDDLPGIVEPMFNDRFVPVRRDALWVIATKRPDVAKEPLRVALLDNHISMRETARQFLSVAGVGSARDFYADAIENGNERQRFAAICGLGETGKAVDVPLVAPFLTSPLTKIRRAVTCAIARLDLEGQLHKLVGVLSDVKPSVSHEALRALQPMTHDIPLADLEDLFAGGADYHVRRNTLTLIMHTSKWKKIPALLKACADKDTRIAEQSNKALRAWSSNYNRSFAEPSHKDFQRITIALSQCEPYLPHGFAVELRACLKSYFK